MSVRTSVCLISLNIFLGLILFVRGEHFYLPKENNVFSNDLQDDWVPVSGIDKRSTRLNNGFSQVVHITPPVRYTNRPVNVQPAASNKIEVFAQPPPTILGSFSEFGHATIEAREPAHTLNFRPSYNFDRHYEESNDRRFQQNDYNEPEDQKPPPAIVVFNAQQRHPQNYQKPPPIQSPPQFYQNFQYHNINNNPNNHNNNPSNYNQNNNHKSFGFKEPPIVQDPPKRLTPYYVSNDHIFPRPQGNNKQVYAEQRPKPYLVNPSDPIQQQHKQHHHHHQHHQQQQPPQQQEYISSTEGGSSVYFQKYPGHVENQNLYPQISNFARPFEQTNGDQNVFIKPNQYVQNLNVGTEVRFGQESGSQPTRPVTVDLSPAFTHPATRPFSKYQTPTPKNEELYRIFPVKEVNALPAFLPTPITLGQQQPANGRPKTPYFKEAAVVGSSSEYDAREEQDENESSEQYDILKSPTKPMSTSTTTTTTTTAAPKTTRKRKPTTTTTTTTTSTTTVVPDDYDEYAVLNRQQLQLQEHQQDYRPRQPYQQLHQDYETVVVPTTTEASTTYAPAREERPIPVSVNKFKKKKPLPSSRPKETYPTAEYEYVPERVTLAPTTTTTVAATTTVATTTTTTASQSSAADVAVSDARIKTKAKYGNGTRPRFSIKDYKTTTSTTTTTSTEKAPYTIGRRTTTTASPTSTDPETVEQPANTTARKSYKPRVRPNRYKAGTLTTTTTDEPQQQQQQDTTTERAAYRSKYKPGKYYNRLRTSTDSATAVVDDGGEPAAATEPTKPAVYSAKRRTVPTIRMAAVQSATVEAAEEHNALRRSSSVSPIDDNTSEAMDAASSEDVDYVATTVAVTPVAPRHKYHTSYVADRPLLPIESFFQSSMTSKRHHNERRW